MGYGQDKLFIQSFLAHLLLFRCGFLAQSFAFPGLFRKRNSLLFACYILPNLILFFLLLCFYFSLFLYLWITSLSRWRRLLPIIFRRNFSLNVHISIEIKVKILSLFYKIELSSLIEQRQVFLHIFIDLFKLVLVIELYQQHLILYIVCELILHIEILKIVVEYLLKPLSQLLLSNTRKTYLRQWALQFQRVRIAKFMKSYRDLIRFFCLSRDFLQ